MRRMAKKSSTADRDRALADVILKSASGRSVLAAGAQVTPKNVKEYLPSGATVEAAAALLKKYGFQIEIAAPTHITIRGPRALFERIFQTTLVQHSIPVFHPPTKARQSYFQPVSPPRIPIALAKLVDGIEFPPPPTYFVSATPPALGYDHLEVPADVARDMDALKAHARGITGNGIRLAMCDTGFLTPLHPYYTGKGYNIQPVASDASDPSPGADDYGHGTGIAACALAVAPGVTFLPVKMHDAPAAAFARAVSLGPHVITNSWGLAYFGSPIFNAALQLAVNNAIASGIVVCFATGNGGQVGWPGGEAGVISVGGALIGDDDSIQASTYASSGKSPFDATRQAPDVCGLTGAAPKGIYIALPTQAGSTVDGDFGGGTFPNGDETTTSDGWVVASGTSSATPMVAGTIALMMQADGTLLGNPSGVRAALNAGCVDVTSGSSASSENAGPGQDNATGFGLVQAYRALNPTDIWMRDNTTSDIGLSPTHGRRPAWPPHAHWTSPDVKVFAAALASPDADFDSTPASEPIFDQDNFVYVRLRNRGLQAAGPVSVRLFYGDPSTNLIFPFDWKNGQSGVPAQGSIKVAASATNLQTVATLGAGATLVAPQAFVWRPPDPTTATQTQVLGDGRIVGHFCLLVRLETGNDPITSPGGTQASVIDDNNIGMHNVSVFSAPATGMFFWSFFVRAAKEPKPRDRTDLLVDLSRLPRRARVVLTLDSKATAKARRIGATVTRHGLQLRTGATPAGYAGLALKPDEKALATLAIRLPAGTPKGRYPVDVLQRTNHVPDGGVTLVAKVTKSS